MKLKHQFSILALVIAWPLVARPWDLTKGIAEIVPKEDVPSFIQILVVSADTLNDPPYNKGNPPRGVFTVHECLRGCVRATKVELCWSATETETDHLPWTNGMPEIWKNSYMQRPATPQWQKIPLPAPALSERIIVFAAENHRPLSEDAQRMTGTAYSWEITKNIWASKKMAYYEVRAVYSLNAVNRQTIAEYAGPSDRDPRIQGMLGSLLLRCTPLWGLLFCLGFALPEPRRWLLWLPAVLVAPASIVLWLLFESGNVTGGIRIDLLIVVPALVLNTVGAIVTARFLLVNRSRVKKKRANQALQCSTRIGEEKTE